MAKFTGSTVQPGQVNDLAGSPVADIQEQVPQASGSIFDELITENETTNPITPEISDAIAEGVTTGIAAEEQAAQERVPTINERLKTTKFEPYKIAAPGPDSGDGGIEHRADNVIQQFGTIRQRADVVAKKYSGEGESKLNLTPSTAAREAALLGDHSQVAIIEAEVNPGSLIAAINRSGAALTVQDPNTRAFQTTVDPRFLAIGSIIAEDVIANQALGESDVEPGFQPPENTTQVAFGKRNAEIGKRLHREYSRLKNQEQGLPTDTYADIPTAEAETLGDAFKNMWVNSLPAGAVEIIPHNNQNYIQVSKQGADMLKASNTYRKKAFPSEHVRPAKNANVLKEGQLPGEQGRTVVTKVKAKAGVPADLRVIKEATVNLSKVPNVVDPQRMKVLFSTIVPALAAGGEGGTFADMYGIGPKVASKFRAKEASTPGYNAALNMEQLRSTIAQSVYAVAQEKDSLNYLTYQISAFNGRITPQQSTFNPTTSKVVRFVTRNATPSKATLGSRVERNLRQMYAMSLVKGAEKLLPPGREDKLLAATPQLKKWGERVKEVINNSMSDADARAVADAIAKGVPLNDPSFPKVSEPQFDPAADADLIRAIRDKKEDGPAFIDGLMDFHSYITKKEKGISHESYFNAYIDGKTNGIASNGIQMGVKEVALKTGVIRSRSAVEQLPEGDLRDALAANLTNWIKTDGFDGNLKEHANELSEVAMQVFNNRDLNKHTTMTFGYGKELESFGKTIETTINELYQEAIEKSVEPGTNASSFIQAVDTLREALPEPISKTLINPYKQKLAEVVSKEAIAARNVMRSAAILNAVADEVFTIKSATGMDILLGGSNQRGFNADETTTYSITEEGKKQGKTAAHYSSYGSAAAPRNRPAEDGTPNLIPGEHAYGGSLPGPVQSLDAATVALSSSGKSWKRLSDASGGQPYLHTIYDAFKMDANGYDVVLEEVNNNWLNASMDWSYLEQTQISTADMIKRFEKKLSERSDNEALDFNVNSGPEKMMGWLLKPVINSKGKISLLNLQKKIMGSQKYNPSEDSKATYDRSWDAVNRIEKRMNAVGFDYQNPKVKDLRAFWFSLKQELNLGERLSAAVRHTNNNKKELRKEIRKSGPVLQYYDH